MTTIEKLIGITAQHNEIVKRVGNGSLDPDNVRKALQDIIEGKFPEIKLPKAAITHVLAKQPSWYVSPEDQLKKVKTFNAALDWGFVTENIPAIPGSWQHNPNEVLMLAVSLPPKGRKSGLHRTFDELWNLIEAPDGYTKYRWDELKATTKLLRQAPGYNHTPGIRWVVFNPNAYHGKSPEAVLKQSKIDNAQLAGLEVLMATLLFPTWATSWNGDSSPYPNMSALQFYWNSGWSRVPYLDRWDVARRLELRAHWAVGSREDFASPSVREC